MKDAERELGELTSRRKASPSDMSEDSGGAVEEAIGRGYRADMARPRGAQTRADAARTILTKTYPRVECALDHRNAFELLAATILSAQCTDKRVNIVTPSLFARYPTPTDLAGANPDELETIIQSTGFFRSKAKSLIGMATAIDDRYAGEVPSDLADLVTVPGVGRKTGNVVRHVWFGLPGLPVDTHVTRLASRLRLTNETDAVKIELQLNAMIPEDERGDFSLRLIEHGRAVCDARKPRCSECDLAEVCPSAGTFGVPQRAPQKKA